MIVTNKRRVAGAAAVAMLACGVTLSACSDEQTPEESTSSSSSSSSTASSSSSSSTPTDPDGARAITVVKNLEKTSDELYRNPKMETGELGAYSTDEAYTQRAQNVENSRSAGEKHSGRAKVLTPEASRRSATSQQVVACIDITGTTIKSKSGKVIEPKYERFERVYTVEKSDGETQDGKWRVTGEEVKETC